MVQVVEYGYGFSSTYIAAANAHVFDADDYIEGVIDGWHRSIFESGIAGAVEEA
jgi:hypothetical protein